jgi:D-arabinose 1-dehydrogenase-like Zn-dependent alcohol dehydrogenase
MAYDKDAIQNGLKIDSFEPKNWAETDIDVRVTHCGVCFSDICSLRSGWVSFLQRL